MRNIAINIFTSGTSDRSSFITIKIQTNIFAYTEQLKGVSLPTCDNAKNEANQFNPMKDCQEEGNEVDVPTITYCTFDNPNTFF